MALKEFSQDFIPLPQRYCLKSLFFIATFLREYYVNSLCPDAIYVWKDLVAYLYIYDSYVEIGLDFLF